MRIKEELRTFTDGAHELALKMIVLADEANLGTRPAADVAKELDAMAREQIANMETIKDLAYRLGRGENRVSIIHVTAVKS